MKKILLSFMTLFLCLNAGAVEIDNRDFNRIYLSRTETRHLFKEDFENAGDWGTGSDGKTSVSLSGAKGIKGKGLKLSYDFKEDGNWCQCYKEINLPATERFLIKLRVKSRNTAHIFEVKFVDDDDTNYGAIIPMNESFKNWKELELKPDDISYLWGGKNTKLDNIKYLYLAVSGGNGKGEILIDEFELFGVREEYAECSLSQAGFHGNDRKRAVLRFLTDRKLPEKFSYSIIDTDRNEPLYRDFFTLTDFNRWKGTYYEADFSGVSRDGKYRMEITIDDKKKLLTNEFEIGDSILYKKATPAVYHFLNYMHCGEYCHPDNPVLGGYHDTFFDINNRMWSLTHLILGLVLSSENSPDYIDIDKNNIDDRIEELLFALRFALQVQLPSGAVGAFGVGHEKPVDQRRLRFEDDDNKKVLDKNPSVHTTCYYVGALANSFGLLKDRYSVLSKKILSSAQKAWDYLSRTNLVASPHIGGYIYASTELYKVEKDKKYLKGILQNLESLSRLQDLDSTNKEEGICGDFFYSGTEKEYKFQYKFFEYNIGILLGLVNVSNLFDYRTREWLKAMYILKVFHELYMKKMASLTPYEQIAHGLEKDNGTYKVAFFTPPYAWTGEHGLNCDHMAFGYLSMLIGYLTDDLSCEEFADNQMQWVLGKNPLKYCMVCGIGFNNPVVWSWYYDKGPIDGGIPNGIIGYNREFPIWRGNDYNSGEYWLPHNAYYLALASLLDSPARISGRICDGGRGVEKGILDIYDGNKLIKSAKINEDGTFDPVTLAPQKEYLVKYTGDKTSVRRKVTALSGERKHVVLDLKESYDIRIRLLEKEQDRIKVGFDVENLSSVRIKAKLLIRFYDGVTLKEENVTLTVQADRTGSFTRDFTITNKNPIIIACNQRTSLIHGGNE